MSDEEREREWEERVRRWRASGLSAREFASQEGVGESTLGLWSRKLAGRKKALGEVGLVRVETGRPVAPAKKTRMARLRLEAPGGVVIHVDEETDLDFLALVLGAMGKES